MLTSDGSLLKKSDSIKERLGNPQESVYSSEAGSVDSRSSNMGLGSVLQQTGEVSESQAQDFDQPIVDNLSMQRGFFGDVDIDYTENVAPMKALLAAEGSITEGKYNHTGVVTEVVRSAGLGDEIIDDAYTGRDATDVFAKRDQRGGWDPDTETVTRTDNVSGLIMAAPFLFTDPWDPETGNLLGDIAAGIAYKMAEPYYEKVASQYSAQMKEAVLTVCTRNANGPALDRMAREMYIAGLHLDTTNKEQYAILSELLRTFRAARGSLAIPANTPSSTTLRMGMPYSEHSIARQIVWSNERKLRHIKEMRLSSGEVVYMASSYMNHQLFTVPVDLDLVDEDLFEDLVKWQQMAMRFCVNQSRSILGYDVVDLDQEIIDDLTKYTGIEYPTVAEALGLDEATNRKVKEHVVKAVREYVGTSMTGWREAVEAKALNKFVSER